MPLQPPDFGKTWGNQNCYWYAINHTGGGDPELGPSQDPGGLSGLPQPGANNADEIEKGIISDGGVRVGTRSAPNMPLHGSRPSYYLVACKCGGGNYHFCRRDETTGDWWNKVPMSAPGRFNPSPTFATPHADSWNPPRMAAFPYLNIWVGYFWIPDAGLPVPQGYKWCTVL
jgi:hypothetical protein